MKFDNQLGSKKNLAASCKKSRRGRSNKSEFSDIRDDDDFDLDYN